MSKRGKKFGNSPDKGGDKRTSAPVTGAASGARVPAAPIIIDLPRKSTPGPSKKTPAKPVPQTPPLNAPKEMSASAPTSSASISAIASAFKPSTPESPQPPPPPPPQPSSEPPMLFEIAWEVCWQLGGIYTVLRTKAPAMLDRWGNRFCFIGPYNPRTAAVEFEEQPTEGIIRQALDRLRDQGIPCHYGRWLIPGRPRVILLDHRARFNRLGEDKYFMWTDHGISTLTNDGEVNEVVAFGFTVTEFFRELTSVAPGATVLAHFHEWMGGVAVPRIAHLRLPVTTVFTTHATLLGRYLAGDNPNFYNQLPYLNSDAEAAKYQILPRHQIEKAAAHASTVFTTVSEVTAVEAEHILGRKPDVILPNGLNIRRFAALHEFQNLHLQYKERIHEFVMGHFFPSYTFDLDRTLYFFTSGRYEYKNKGLDLFIESMWRLNEQLKQMPDPPTIVAFIVTRAAVKNINVGVLQSQMQLADLRNLCEEVQGQMGHKLFMAIAAQRLPTFNELINDEAWVRLKRAIHAQLRPYQPPIVTHDLIDDQNDPVLKHLRHRHLFNSADDPVKVIFHPEFVTATSPLIGLDYEQFVRGCHLGVFPSYYEPWGYTPMESAALGLPAVTTDLSGFGAYIQRHIPNHEEQGMVVLPRRNVDFDTSADQLAAQLYAFAQMSRRQRIEIRNKVERLSEQFDWSKLARHYHDAHDLAIERTGGKRPGRMEIKMV
jgi:glycogen(starch) synthase